MCVGVLQVHCKHLNIRALMVGQARRCVCVGGGGGGERMSGLISCTCMH